MNSKFKFPLHCLFLSQSIFFSTVYWKIGYDTYVCDCNIIYTSLCQIVYELSFDIIIFFSSFMLYSKLFKIKFFIILFFHYIMNFIFAGLPQEMYNMWYNFPYPFNEAVCVCQGFAAETSANATVLTITAFTIERYLLISFSFDYNLSDEYKMYTFHLLNLFIMFFRYVAICHPFLSHTMSKLSRAVKFVLAIWVIAMCLAIPQVSCQFEYIFSKILLYVQKRRCRTLFV